MSRLWGIYTVTPNQELALSFIKNNPGCDTTDVCYFINISERNFRNIKNILVALGCIYEGRSLGVGHQNVRKFYPSESNIKKKHK